MPYDWREISLGEFVRLQRGYDLTASERRPGTVPVMGSAGQNGSHDTPKVQGPGVVIGRSGVGSMGVVSYCANDYWPHNTVLYVTDFLGNDERFTYYFLRHLNLRRFNSGSAQASLNRNYIYPLRVRVPGLKEQRAIANCLSLLDERIELNRQLNETLEETARAIFKSWFIDYDPVRAKAAGREPEGMAAETAALFPGMFKQSDLGTIPEGWTVSTLSEHVRTERGLSYTGEGLCSKDVGIPMHNLNSVYEGGGYKREGIKYYAGEFKNRHLALPGDIIVANTEQGHHHRLIGFPALVPANYTKSIYSHHIYRVRLLACSSLTPHTLYYLLMSPPVRGQIIAYSNGSTVNMLKPEGLEVPRFASPPAAIARAFEAIVASILASKEANVDRTDALTELRDFLLPRLVSGQLRIPEAQEALAEALA